VFDCFLGIEKAGMIKLGRICSPVIYILKRYKFILKIIIETNLFLYQYFSNQTPFYYFCICIFYSETFMFLYNLCFESI
jgi:hypothetical protein